MITLTNNELQLLEIDSFLPKMYAKLGFTSSNLMGYEMILKVKSPLAEKIVEEYNNASADFPAKMKMLNTEFIIKGLETKMPLKLMVDSIGETDSLNALVTAGLKI